MTDQAAPITGRLHSYETLGTLDGPGLRLVVFLQGCPLRCLYCHNPDTWDLVGGRPITVAEIIAKAQRMRPYFGTTGGVTLSGGEPLAQPHFTLALLQALKREGIHTVLDTSGTAIFTASERAQDQDSATIQAILDATDLVLLDIKAPTATGFQALTGRSIAGLEQFIELAHANGQAIWIRQVIVPGMNDNQSDLKALRDFLQRFPRLQIGKIELLPYHTLGVSKYKQLGIPYPLAEIGALPAEKLAELQQEVDSWSMTVK
ncbi:MAG: pyruvate formate lyase-activating protein [Clostridia bacterium]|nr:pyruvate formate lyase-activating protein [Clostridia bacterium]NCC75449.1 pyruvate formate lyase-activating protein [Clostridia bacterium]